MKGVAGQRGVLKGYKRRPMRLHPLASSLPDAVIHDVFSAVSPHVCHGGTMVAQRGWPLTSALRSSLTYHEFKLKEEKDFFLQTTNSAYHLDIPHSRGRCVMVAYAS